MSEFYRNQHALMDMIENHQKESKEYLERHSKVTIYGYLLHEILDIIEYAKKHGYSPLSEKQEINGIKE